PMTLLSSPSELAIRQEFEDLILADLLGPAGGPEEEVDESRVSDRYLVGMLAPQRTIPSAAEEDDYVPAGDDTTDEGIVDPGVNSPRWMFPSSMGFSCTVDGDARALRVTARWGRYQRSLSETITLASGEPKRI